MGKNRENHGIQQGALDHAPSQHGEKTLARLAEIAHTPREPRGDSREVSADGVRQHDAVGQDRLFEDRQQHDEAEKNSEKTRLARDLERHKHLPNKELPHRDIESFAKRKN
jgi:hypothetical protein